MWLGSGVAVALAPIPPLIWELLLLLFFFFNFLGLHPWHMEVSRLGG